MHERQRRSLRASRLFFADPTPVPADITVKGTSSKFFERVTRWKPSASRETLHTYSRLCRDQKSRSTSTPSLSKKKKIRGMPKKKHQSVPTGKIAWTGRSSGVPTRMKTRKSRPSKPTIFYGVSTMTGRAGENAPKGRRQVK